MTQFRWFIKIYEEPYFRKWVKTYPAMHTNRYWLGRVVMDVSVLTNLICIYQAELDKFCASQTWQICSSVVTYSVSIMPTITSKWVGDWGSGWVKRVLESSVWQFLSLTTTRTRFTKLNSHLETERFIRHCARFLPSFRQKMWLGILFSYAILIQTALAILTIVFGTDNF